MHRRYIPGLVLLAAVSGAMLTGIVWAGDQATAPAAASAGPAASARSGRDIWKGTCQVCHATGMLGAPRIGNKAAWAPRIAKGMDTLKDHALHGFNEMPAKGGNEALSDEDVVKALEYMVSQSK
jgi:cytochrome c5